MEQLDTADEVNELHKGTWAEALAVHVVSVAADEVRATVTLRSAHLQPFGIVHGGVYLGVIETIASVGAGLDARAKGKNIVGIEHTTSFVRAVRAGTLDAIATAITRGRRTQLWEATLRDEGGAVVASGRVRFLVLEPDALVGGGALGHR
jgi:uncharacterized protein (TIGR00369 family)